MTNTETTNVKKIDGAYRASDGSLHPSAAAARAHDSRAHFQALATEFADRRGLTSSVRTRAINQIVDFLLDAASAELLHIGDS